MMKAPLEGLRVLEIGHLIDCARDPRFVMRGIAKEIGDPQLGPVMHYGVLPHIPEGPGNIRWPGPAIGAHTDEVLTELLGVNAPRIAQLRAKV